MKPLLLLKTLLIRLGFLPDPEIARQKKLNELIEWAKKPVPAEEAQYVILQPKESYPYKVQYKHGQTKIVGYAIKAYARTREEAETKESVFTKLWLDQRPVMDENKY